jgi:hypothetical protein
MCVYNIPCIFLDKFGFSPVLSMAHDKNMGEGQKSAAQTEHCGLWCCNGRHHFTNWPSQLSKNPPQHSAIGVQHHLTTLRALTKNFYITAQHFISLSPYQLLISLIFSLFPLSFFLLERDACMRGSNFLYEIRKNQVGKGGLMWQRGWARICSFSVKGGIYFFLGIICFPPSCKEYCSSFIIMSIPIQFWN